MKRARLSAIEMNEQSTSQGTHSTGAIPKTLPILPLHHTSCHGQPFDIEVMQKHLDLDPGSLNRLLKTKHTPIGTAKLSPLHYACQSLHVDCVKFLLDRGATVDLDSSDGNNAIYYTIFGHQYSKDDPRCAEIVEEILKHKKPTDNIYKNEEQFTTEFKNLIDHKLYSIIKLLFEYNEIPENMLPENDFPKFYDTSFSPFTLALLNRDLELAKICILYGDKVLNYTRIEKQFAAVPTALLKIYKVPEEFFRAIYIFHCFGGSLWTKQTHICGHDRIDKTAIEHLRDTPKLSRRFGNLVDNFEDIMCNPLSLKDQCRLTLWKSKGKNYLKEVREIQEVPKEVMDFLELKNL